MGRVVLGIDGGGTKTRCLVADLAGQVLGEGLAGPANHHAVGVAGAAAAVMGAAQGALAAAGFALDDVGAVCAGLAGAGTVESQAAIAASLSFPAGTKVQVVPDARIALAGALGGKPGVTVISGTGSIAFGVDARGQTLRAGGWGFMLGDEGSGYDIGRRAIAAALAVLDGAGPATSLGPTICEAWGLERIEQVVPRVYGDVAAAKTQIAALVPRVIAVAAEGDAVAASLLAGAGRDLGALAAAVVRRLALPASVEALVAVTGGVLSGCAPVREAFRAALAELAPGARLIESEGGPAEGAVLMGLQL